MSLKSTPLEEFWHSSKCFIFVLNCTYYAAQLPTLDSSDISTVVVDMNLFTIMWISAKRSMRWKETKRFQTGSLMLECVRVFCLLSSISSIFAINVFELKEKHTWKICGKLNVNKINYSNRNGTVNKNSFCVILLLESIST